MDVEKVVIIVSGIDNGINYRNFLFRLLSSLSLSLSRQTTEQISSLFFGSVIILKKIFSVISDMTKVKDQVISSGHHIVKTYFYYCIKNIFLHLSGEHHHRVTRKQSTAPFSEKIEQQKSKVDHSPNHSHSIHRDLRT